MRISRLTPLAVLAVVAAGCGSNSPSSTSAGGPPSADQAYQQAVKFSSCMRSHGVRGFPDPETQSGGGISLSIRKGSGLDPSSPTFKAAMNACRKYTPGRGKAKPLSAAQQQQFIRYAQCIRTHGVPNFPDPDFSGGGVRMKFVGTGPGNPGFDRAQKACQSMLPGANGKGGSVGFGTQAGPK